MRDVEELKNLTVSTVAVNTAVRSGKIEEVWRVLQSLNTEFLNEPSQKSIACYFTELATWDLSENPRISSNVVLHLYAMLADDQRRKEVCRRVVLAQPPVAVQILVPFMLRNGWMLLDDDCPCLLNKLNSMSVPSWLDEAKSEELATRTAANCLILRASGTPTKLLKKVVLDRLKPLNPGPLGLPLDFLNQLVNCVPFHPIAIFEDSRDRSNMFLIPQVYSPAKRFHLEVEQLTKFLQPGTEYKKENAPKIRNVLHATCERLELMEELGAGDIGKVVDFWIAALRIFDGYGISIEDVRKTGEFLEKTANSFEVLRRPLFLKHFLRKLSEQKEPVAMEPQIVSLIISTFQRTVFRVKDSVPEVLDEFGDFWTLVLKMKYDDVYGATSYFTSAFSLAQAQAVFRVKKELCRAVYEKILKPMYQQIVDFTELKKKESEEATTNEKRMMMEHRNIGSGEFTLLLCTYKIAEERILEFINE